MKIVIAGGRDHYPTVEEAVAVALVLRSVTVTEIVSGGARGVDTWAIDLAKSLGIPCKIFMADWDLYGKSAGYKRNFKMAQYSDAVILLTGGIGTQNMRKVAKEQGLKILYDVTDK